MDLDLMEYQYKIIELLVQHEEAISQLYKVYADKFPARRQFWTVLHLEELEHASWIRTLHPKIDEGYLKFNEERFKIKIIYDSLDNIMEQVSEAKAVKLSFIEALIIALNIEETIIESKFFQVYKTDSEELAGLLRSLEGAYIEHRDRLKETLDKTSSRV